MTTSRTGKEPMRPSPDNETTPQTHASHQLTVGVLEHFDSTHSATTGSRQASVTSPRSTASTVQSALSSSSSASSTTAEFRSRLFEDFLRIPPDDAERLCAHTLEKKEDKREEHVGRDKSKDVGKRVYKAVEAHIRHAHTKYNQNWKRWPCPHPVFPCWPCRDWHHDEVGLEVAEKLDQWKTPTSTVPVKKVTGQPGTPNNGIGGDSDFPALVQRDAVRGLAGHAQAASGQTALDITNQQPRGADTLVRGPDLSATAFLSPSAGPYHAQQASRSMSVDITYHHPRDDDTLVSGLQFHAPTWASIAAAPSLW